MGDELDEDITISCVDRVWDMGLATVTMLIPSETKRTQKILTLLPVPRMGCVVQHTGRAIQTHFHPGHGSQLGFIHTL